MHMFSSVFKEHQERQSQLKTKTEIERRAAVDASRDLTVALIEHLNVGVANAYTKQKEIDTQLKRLISSTEKLSKQSKQWANLFANLNNSFKQLGDIENWTESIERDMTDIQEKMLSFNNK